MNTSILEFIKTFFTGLGLGMITVIPGLSTGTMAIVFNVYDRLINIITPNLKKIFSQWKFLLPLAAGAAAGVFLFSKVITLLYQNFPLPTLYFFIGLIAGSLPLVCSRVIAPAAEVSSGRKVTIFSSFLCTAIALAVMIVMAVFKPVEGDVIYTALTPALFALLFTAGILTAIAMIVPGISGAFLLLVMGFYRTVLQAVSALNFPLLVPFVLGAGAGLLAGAALVRFLLSKVPGQTYGAVLGLVAGSIIVLFPGSFGEGATIIFSIITLLAGCAFSFFLGRRKVKSL